MKKLIDKLISKFCCRMGVHEYYMIGDKLKCHCCDHEETHQWRDT